jgi:hypothetical protein
MRNLKKCCVYKTVGIKMKIKICISKISPRSKLYFDKSFTEEAKTALFKDPVHTVL